MFSAFNADLPHELAAANVAPMAAEAVIAQRAKLAAIEPPGSMPMDTHLAIRRAIDEAFLTGFRRVMLLAAFLALASAISSWLMIGGDPARARARED
jgi:hypothetical protein